MRLCQVLMGCAGPCLKRPGLSLLGQKPWRQRYVPRIHIEVVAAARIPYQILVARLSKASVLDCALVCIAVGVQRGQRRLVVNGVDGWLALGEQCREQLSRRIETETCGFSPGQKGRITSAHASGVVGHAGLAQRCALRATQLAKVMKPAPNDQYGIRNLIARRKRT